MGTLPQAPTAEDFRRLENNLWHGLSIHEDHGSKPDGLARANDGLGFIIGEPTPGPLDDVAAEQANSTNTEDTPTAEPEAGDGGSEDDTDWWQGDDGDV